MKDLLLDKVNETKVKKEMTKETKVKKEMIHETKVKKEICSINQNKRAKRDK